MDNFFLTISFGMQDFIFRKNEFTDHDPYSEKDIHLVSSKIDNKQSFKSTENLFTFCYSRIENFDELVKKFNLHNIKSDADLVLNLFNLCGQEAFVYLVGSFSVVIYDKNNKNLFAASDHNNFYPIYFVCKNKGAIFTSDPSIFFSNKILQKELDEEILFDYLVCGLPREGRTIYKNVNHVTGSSCVYLSKNFTKISFNRYFSFQSDYKSAEYSTQKTKDVFLKAIYSKLKKIGTNVGTLLSGGLDSSSITSTIDHLNKNKKLNKKIHTYSAIFPDLDDNQKAIADESKFIDYVLSSVDSSSTKIPFNINGPLKILDELTDICEPALAPNLYITFSILKKLQQKNIRYLFDGSGGDSVVGHGHARFRELGQSFKFASLFREYGYFSKRKSKVLSRLDLIKRFVLKPLTPFSLQKRKLLSNMNRIDYFQS